MRRSLILPLFIFFFAQLPTAHAQHWKKIFQLPTPPDLTTPGAFNCGYFWSPTHALVGGYIADTTYQSVGHPGIYYTDDGIHWRPASVPWPPYWSYMTSIYMKDLDTGWASFDTPRPNTPVLWRTTDGGKTWRIVSGYVSGGFQESVNPAPGSYGTHYGFGWTGISCISYSQTTQSPILLAVGKDHQFSEPRDDQIAISFVNDDSGATLGAVHMNYITTDGGRSWQERNCHGGAFSIYWSRYWNRIFVHGGFVDPVNAGKPRGVISGSDDGQLTWRELFIDTTMYGLTGLDGRNKAVYSQQMIRPTLDTVVGLIRTTDGGESWKTVGGPPRDGRQGTWDSWAWVEIHVLGCAGEVVFAFDDSGGIWRTTDGGDGELPEPLPGPMYSVRGFDTIPACSRTQVLGTFLSNDCDDGLAIRAAAIVGDTAHFRLNGLSGLPLTLGGRATDSFYVDFDPHGAAGVFHGGLHLVGTITTTFDTTVFDTVLALNAASSPVGPVLHSLLSSLTFDTLSICAAPRDTVIRFINQGCAPDTVIALTTTNSSFTLDSILLPLPVPVDSAFLLHVLYRSRAADSDSGFMRIVVVSQGVRDTVSISLSGTGSFGSGELSLLSPLVDAGVRSICANDTTIVARIANSGCDTLRLSGFAIAGDADFLLANFTDTLIPPSSNLSIPILFRPLAKNERRARLTFHSQNLHGAVPGMDTVLDLQGWGTDGTRILVASVAAIDLKAHNICEQVDSTIMLTNTGCDTLTITKADLTGQGFAYDGALPIVLKPNESASITVHSLADTTGHPTSVNGTLQFTSTAQNALPPITLTRSFTYPAKLRIEAVSDASAKAGEEVKFKVLLEGDVPKGMSALYFDLSNDDDLLSFESSTGVSQVGAATGKPVTTRTFTVSPVSTGEIGEVTFHTYLAKSNMTSLTLSNLHFDYPNLTVPPDCIASIEGSGSDFTYIYQCSEGLIQHFMQTSELAIESISPNPASRTITVKSRGVAEMSLVDVLGHEVMMVAPASSTTIDVSHLSPGVYYLRAEGGGSVRTTRIVIER